MNIIQTSTFKNQAKKLFKNQKKDLDEAVRSIAQDPSQGESKCGDLADVQVYKFKMLGQLTLLAYQYFEKEVELLLLTFGSHENFYRDIKKNH